MSLIWEADNSREQYWRSDADARERADEHWNEIQMADVSFDAPVERCDGSGITYEEYVDVDRVIQERCPGCIACRLQQDEDDLEMARRRAPVRESGDGARKVA